MEQNFFLNFLILNKLEGFYPPNLKMTSKIQDKIIKTEKKLAELNAKLKQETDKTGWVKISNEFISSVNSINGKCQYEISTKQQFNGKTYAEILKEVKEEEIADYPLLQKLRNSGKFEFLKEFWVFVPNPDEISKKNSFVARFVADSDWASLNCYRLPVNSNPSLGVFLIRKVKK